MIDNDYDSLFPVVKYSHPIQRALKISQTRLVMNYPENYPIRTQDLEGNYHDSGQFYWMEVNAFLKEKQFLTANSGTIILSDLQVQDIDTIDDWMLAEIKYKLQMEMDSLISE